MVSLSHLQRLCHWILIFFERVQKHHLQAGSQWHFGRRVYETVFAFSLVYCEMEFFSSDLVGVSNRLLRVSNLALLAVCGSQSVFSELPLVTPLAFSDLALAHLRGTLLILGWVWCPLDLCITLELVCCKGFLLCEQGPCHCSPILFSDCMNDIMHGSELLPFQRGLSRASLLQGCQTLVMMVLKLPYCLIHCLHCNLIFHFGRVCRC